MWQCECVGSWWQRSNDIGNRDGGKSRGLHALQTRTKTLLACSMVCGIGGGNDFDLLFLQIVVSVCLHVLEKKNWKSPSVCADEISMAHQSLEGR